MKFTSPLILRAFSPREVWAADSSAQLYQVMEDFVCESERYGRIVVSAGTVTDFASVPRLALTFIDDDAPQILFPSVVHDYLYTMRGVTPERTFTRHEADDLLRDAMLECGASRLITAIVYQAVRFGGVSHWQS